MANKRVSKHWKINPRINIEKFDRDSITKDNLVNQILVIQEKDICSSLVMDLFGSFNGETMVNHYDTFEVPAGAFKFIDDKGKEVSNSTPFTTTFGIWIFNIFMIQGLGLSHVFGGYVNENIDSDIFEDMHQKLLYAMLEDRVDTETYKKFIEYANFVMPWETIFSPSHTESILACSKEINKLKAKLIKENKEAIDKGDAVVAETIQDELIAFAKEYLKDDPALDPYLSGAGGNIHNNFKNMYIMKGAIRNTDPNSEKEFDIATSSFIDGITTDDYTSLAKSLSGGPYSRSKKTELGGYWEKLVTAALNTVVVDEEGSDCGTKHYLEITLTKKNSKMFMYSYIVKSNGQLEELTSENLNAYIGKTVKIRSTMFCKSKTGGVCHHCAGNFFYRRGSRTIGLACASIPTVLKLKSMKSFHDSTINTTEINANKAFLEF